MNCDDFDRQSSRNHWKLKRELDSLLADDKRWTPTDWPRKYRIARLFGFAVGLAIGIAIFSALKHFIF